MRKVQREKTFDIRASLEGLVFVFVCIVAFLLFMGMVIVAIRFVVG